jgi:hypothetical protein
VEALNKHEVSPKYENDKLNRKSIRQRIYVVHPKIKWATYMGRNGEKFSL